MNKEISIILFYFLTILIDTGGQENKWSNFSYFDAVWDITEDNSNLWVGTTGGLVKIEKSSKTFHYYNKANSPLKFNSIRSLYCDSKSRLWVGYSGNYDIGGLCMFDGINWVYFNKENSNLPYNTRINNISEDSKGNIWFSPGFYLSNYSGQSFRNEQIYPIINIPYSTRRMVIDREDHVWYERDGGGIFVYIPEDQKIKGMLNGNNLVEDNKGQIWVKIGNELICFLGKSNINNLKGPNSENFLIKLDAIQLPDDYLSMDNIRFDRNDNLWFTCKNKLVKVIDGKFQEYLIPLNEYEYSHCIYFDSQNTLWLGCTNHLFEFKNGIWTEYKPSGSGLVKNSVSGIAIDGFDMWVTFQGEPAKCVKHDIQLNSWEAYDINQRLIPYNILYNDSIRSVWHNPMGVSIIYDKQNRVSPWIAVNNRDKILKSAEAAADEHLNVWAVLQNKLTYITRDTFKVANKEDFLPFNSSAKVGYDLQAKQLFVSSLPDDEQDFGIFGYISSMGWQNLYTCKTSREWVSCFLKDPEDNIYLGLLNRQSVGINYGGGLLRFDGNQWQSYTVSNSSLPSNSVVSLCLDKEQNLWIGTYGGGVAKIDKNDSWTIFDFTNSALPGNNIEHMEADQKGNVWVAVQGAGITIIPKDAKPFEKFRADSSEVQVKIFPNPTRDILSVNIILQNPGSVEIKLFDLTGRLIKNLGKTYGFLGLNELKFQTGDLTSNKAYLCTVFVNGKVFTKRVIKI